MSDVFMQSRCLASGVDRAIKVSAAGAVFTVAGIAAYISYWHAYAVVREFGESGLTARLEPATIDGLVYACSMVMLYAAWHRRPVPALARWLLALGIAATVAANMAQGLAHGVGGAIVAAWPAASLVGSYELLVWIIRTSADLGPDRVPDEGAADQPADQAEPGDWPVWTADGPAGQEPAPVPDHVDEPADQPASPVVSYDVDAEAVEVYLASLRAGQPLSERKLAARFGRTSRRWARNRMQEARARKREQEVEETAAQVSVKAAA